MQVLVTFLIHLWNVFVSGRNLVQRQWRGEKNRPQDNFKWEIKSGRKPCQNLLKNRFFSFKNVIKKYECFCDLLPSLFYKLSATQKYRTVRCDGWELLIIFTEDQNSPCYMLLLKRWGYSESTFISSSSHMSYSPWIFKQLLPCILCWSWIMVGW